MNGKRVYLISFTVVVLLLGALIVYLIGENARLNKRIQQFIPAAIDLENEQKLKEATILQQQQVLDSLYNVVDSCQNSKPATSATPNMFTNSELKQPTELPTQRDNSFKDLNKGFQ